MANMNNLEERNLQVLNDISELQKNETQLYIELNNSNTSPARREQIIKKINELSQMRLNMFTNLKNMYNYQQQNISNTSDVISSQMSAIDAIENELNQTKIEMNKLREEDYNKLRLVQINTYYGKRYNAYADLMKTIALICIPIIILGVLGNKGFLPNMVYTFLMSIVLIIGLIIIGRQVLDISNRDNMNWDEYNWYFDKSKAPKGPPESSTSTSNPWEFPSMSLTCIGSSCCYEGSTYDDVDNICLPDKIYYEKYPEKVKETFISNALGKYGNMALKSINNNAIIMPTESEIKIK